MVSSIHFEAKKGVRIKYNMHEMLKRLARRVRGITLGVWFALLCTAVITTAVWEWGLTVEDRGAIKNKIHIALDDLLVPDLLEHHRDRDDLIRVRADLLANYPELEALDKRELVVALRDIAHRQVTAGTAGGQLGRIWQAYDEAFRQKTAEHSCQGINVIYRVMLAAFGFETRLVSLFASDFQKWGEVVLSHASSDVLIGRVWEAMDPTFNISLRDGDGRRISWVQMYEAAQAGKSFKVESDGYAPLPARGVADQGVRLEQYAIYLVVIGVEVEFQPSDWDGTFEIEETLWWNLGHESLPIDYRLPKLGKVMSNSLR